MTSGLPHGLLVQSLPLEAKKTQNGMERSQTEFSFPEAGWREPMLVERQSARHHVCDPLMQTRDQETSDSSIDHNAGRGSDNVTRPAALRTLS